MVVKAPPPTGAQFAVNFEAAAQNESRAAQVSDGFINAISVGVWDAE